MRLGIDEEVTVNPISPPQIERRPWVKSRRLPRASGYVPHKTEVGMRDSKFRTQNGVEKSAMGGDMGRGCDFPIGGLNLGRG